MAIVTGDRYLEKLVKFVEAQAGPLIDGSLVLKLNPVGLHYVHSRLDALHELESLLTGAPVDYLRAYVSDLGDHRALEQLRRILRLIPSLKVVSVLPAPARDPTPLSLVPFARLRVLELRGCDLSTSAARGLLELRDTLEKIVCHNSTDALRHVFASRIAEIKGMPQWKRLWFVSVACNGLVLMDESLQLLPAVEILDLSRNKFAKLDNLSKCTRLKHLDLGFNQLRSIAPFMQVSCHIVKLVLRSNALTTLHGIENLKSLEGLDVSYNIISNFTELEVLTGLPSLQSLWLEGNPFCCARWYRAHVFSYFNDPDKLQLDEKEMTTREYWQRQIIIASRQKQPASFGFYSPAKVDTGEGSINRKRKKISRLASIESEGENIHACSDEESISFDAENGSKEDDVIPEDEAEIVDLMNKVERMKKERSALWLWEFKQWMDENSENVVAISKYSGGTLKNEIENDMNNKAGDMHIGESSRYAGDESSTYILESDNSFADTSGQLHTQQYFDQSGLERKSDGISLPATQRKDLRQGDHESHTSLSVQADSSLSDTLAARGGQWIKENESISPMKSIDNIVGSYSSSDRHGSPPFYQKDILHRRHNLVEEILQLSAESFSVPSSDSDTSSSGGDFCQFDFSVPEDDRSQKENWHVLSSASLDEDNNYEKRYGISQVRENGVRLLNSSAEQTSSSSKLIGHSMQLSTDALSPGAHDGQSVHCVDLQADLMENKNSNRKPKRRSILLSEENHIIGNTEISQKYNELNTCRDDVEDQLQNPILSGGDQEVTNKKQTWTSTIPSDFCCSSPGIDDFVESYFNTNIADSSMHETCRQYIHCDCIFEQESSYSERDVVLLLSSEHKLYMLLVGDAFNESGSTVSLLGCHMLEDVREILVGLGLQVVRVYIERGAEYQFLTRSIEKSRQLFRTMQVFDSFPSDERCSLRSLEQVQVELFEKYICGGSQVSIFQYSMVHFWCSCNGEESWVSRSLFVVGGHVLVCIEDLKQFSTLTVHASSTYFSLDTCCSITDISEMAIENRCVCLSVESKSAAINTQSRSPGSVTWKLKWFSEENLVKFVDLLKAVHGGTNVSPFVVKCIQ